MKTIKDLTGQKIGKLTMLKYKRENNCTYWYCKCDCGNERWVKYKILVKMKIANCGCIRKERAKTIVKLATKKHLENNIVHGTNIAAINPTSIRPDNRSGVTGVSWDRERNKWISVIAFKKKHYHLGRYDNKEDAIKIRKQAEEKLFGEFLEWYNNQRDNQR